ncbi:MAG: tripartite tricarboxylate transporter TctB family protein [Gammaproteobacteria bacterium]|nr:MAG: tripartite tricarboxylate transporter TctB family protein [Gammaproteobacteria bacterium]
MRRAELVMAVVLAVFSCYLMWKSSELPVGWIPERGPGPGAFPFWLAAGMLACCGWIILRWLRGVGPLVKSEESYMDRHSLNQFLLGAGSLGVMIGLIHVIGVYGSVPLFLIFYMRVLGGHTWMKTGTIAILSPVITFLFFELALKITLPKGFTEPMFYPIYDLVY